MKKLLLKSPELFQGEKNLKSNKTYFEGWYFKNTNNKNAISFIPGININGKEKQAFIQIITNENSYFIKYEISAFKFNHNPFYIKVGNSFFSKEKIYIDIKDHSQNLIILGEIKYTNSQNIKSRFLSPNIMGPFSCVPFMECNHAILSMKNEANGFININNQEIKFKKDIGYIEKDWGYSFPKSYIWCQGNNFKNSNTSFILSIANIPFKIFRFTGIICALIIENKEYRFATYNNTKILKYDVSDNSINITLKKGRYSLNVKTSYNNVFKLIAPVKGNMTKDILESISSPIEITLKKNNKIIYNDISSNCGLEIVLE